MELAAIIAIGVLFGSGIYLLLKPRLLRVVFGSALISHAVNLLLLTSGRLKRGGAPLVGDVPAPVTDPLPQALILTAIVIGLGTTALILVLAYRIYQEKGTDDLRQLRGLEDES
ncbi:MAG: Na(+)/H(+) antiporter subunit C [Firmicutes bacterium]|nr:Na(+)/H(+) antiporter subunit C [Bacillota bacterium]